jgi:ABC-2 type transport system permease protein
VVDENHTQASEPLVKGLKSEGSLVVRRRPAPKNGAEQPEYTTAAAEAAVKAGDAPVALIVPHGVADNPISFGGATNSPAVQLLKDSSDMVASQMVAGLLQKVAMTSMPDVMAEIGSKYMDRYAGGFTAEQRERINAGLDYLRREESKDGAATPAGGVTSAGIIPVKTRDVVGENKRNPMVSFYAAAIGVMFLLFTASGAAGSLLDETESGTLDRVLSSHVTMGKLLAGKLAFNTVLAFSQLVLMFMWAWAVFKLDFIPHISGFVVMGVSTALRWAPLACCWLASVAREHNWARFRRW